MKMKIGWCAAILLAVAMIARASVIVYNQALVNETALAYNKTYPIDLQLNGINTLSAQAVYSSATVANVTFGDGTQSKGNITVVNYAALTLAAASDHLTVSTVNGLTGARLSLPGFVLQEGLDWKAVGTTTGTAASLVSALNHIPFISASRAGSVVYTTAPAGSYYNSLQMVSSTPTALTVAALNFAGGQDNAIVSVNGIPLLQGRDFTAATSNAATATSLKNGINANAALNSFLSASVGGAIVYATSTLAGAQYNFGMVSSTPAALSVSGANMTGGTNPADTLGSSIISIPNHGLTTALPVVYSTAGGVIGGLTNLSTYYAVVVDANDVKLASSAAQALLGLGLTVTSTSTQVTAHTFTLAPVGISGTPSFKWEVSINGLNWTDLAASSVTLSSYSNPPASTLWSFGYIGVRYLRLNVVAPTTGGLGLNVRVIGTN